MKEPRNFEDPQFGEIRAIAEGTSILVCGSDVASALRYARPAKAVMNHCKGVPKRDILTNGGILPIIERGWTA